MWGRGEGGFAESKYDAVEGPMPTVMVIYYSKSGNTKRMAELVAAGAQQVEGVEVEMIALPGFSLHRVVEGDAYAIGSPDYYSYMAGHVKTFFDEALTAKDRIAGKPYVAFGTHGGGAKVVETIEKLAQSLGLRRVADGMMTLGAPGPGEEEAVRELGHALARAARET